MEQRNEIQIHFKKQLCGNILNLFNIVQHVVEGKIYPIVPTFISNFSIKKREIPFFYVHLIYPLFMNFAYLMFSYKMLPRYPFCNKNSFFGNCPKYLQVHWWGNWLGEGWIYECGQNNRKTIKLFAVYRVVYMIEFFIALKVI